MRRTPGILPCSFSRSKLETPPGRIETIASGHSGDGTKALISEPPQTSTATNAPKPKAKERNVPRWRFRGIRLEAASSGRTASARRSVNSAATAASAGAAANDAPTAGQAIAGPFGKSALSAPTQTSVAATASAEPSAEPRSASASASPAQARTTPRRVRPSMRFTARLRRLASTDKKTELTSRHSAVRTAAQRRRGFA